MPFPVYGEDDFAPEEEEDELVQDWADPDFAPDLSTEDQLFIGEQMHRGWPPEGVTRPYQRGIIDSPEYWMGDVMQGQGYGRPQMQEWDNRVGSQGDTGPSVRLPNQGASLTPPYGTRREPSVNSVAQDPNDINQFIRRSLQQEEYGDMPPEARDVHEQIDMIRGAAPRMPPQDIQRFLEEQMRGQGYMLPPQPEDAVPPEYEEEVFRGRRFGRR